MSLFKQLLILIIGIGLFILGVGLGQLSFQGLGYGLALIMFLGSLFAIAVILVSLIESYFFKKSFWQLTLINLGTCILTVLCSLPSIIVVLGALEKLLLHYESSTVISIIMFGLIGLLFFVIKSIFIVFLFEDSPLRKQMILFNALVGLAIGLLGIFLYSNFINYLPRAIDFMFGRFYS